MPSHCPPAHRGLALLACIMATCALAQPAAAVDASTIVADARRYEHGEGVPRDVARAIRLYCAAARAGDAEAQFSLGWIYANGRGVRRSDAHAAYFFERAMRGSHPNAHRMLAVVGSEATPAAECHLDTAQHIAAAPADSPGIEPALRLSLTMAQTQAHD